MSKSAHQIAVKAVDQTAGAFGSIQRRASMAGAKLKSMLGGALAAAGVYMGIHAITDTINELGKLSDVAQKTGTNVSEITKATNAFKVLGIQADVNTTAKAFQMMTKNTGRVGMKGFYETIEQLGKIPDLSERSAAAMKVFGRSGMEFMPLINAANEGTDALKQVIATMPGISQSAAEAGDAAADAMSMLGDEMKSIWGRAVGKMIGWFTGDMPGGARSGAAMAAAYLEYWAKVAYHKCSVWFSKWGNFWKDVGWSVATLFEGDTGFFERFDKFGREWGRLADERAIENAELDKEWEETYRKLNEDLEKAKENAEKFGEAYNNAAKGFAANTEEGLENVAEAASAAKKSLRNELIVGGSNAALKMQLMGPQLESEQKKTNRLLEKIEKNTAQKPAVQTFEVVNE